MTVGKFVWRTSLKIVAIVLISMLIAYILSPIITNQLAMTQMENSNEMYFYVSAIAKIKPIAVTVGNGIILALFAGIGLDIRKLVKSINNTKNEKEN